MNDIGYKTYWGDGTGKNYVITDDNNKVLEVSYRGYVLSVAGENMIKDEKGNMYISGYKAMQIENEKLKNKVKRLKRMIDKLDVELIRYENWLLTMLNIRNKSVLTSCLDDKSPTPTNTD